MAEVPHYPTTLWSLIERRVAASGESTMFVDDHGRRLTYRGYRRRSETTAAALARHHSIGPGDTVSWQLPTGLESMIVLGALARLGAVQNPIIPILRTAEVSEITEQVQPQLMIVPRQFRGFDHTAMASALSNRHGFDVLTLDLDDLTGPDPMLPSADPNQLPPPPAVDATRWIYHSSGTTAAPKGIRHTDSSVMHGATGLAAVLGMGPDDVYPIAFPNAHIGGVNNLTAQLLTGATLALSAGFDRVRSPQFMASVGATYLGSAIPFFTAYLDAQAASDVVLFPKLRACVNGGAPKTPELHRRVRDELGGVGVIGSYGLTEFPIATMGSLFDSDEQIARTEGRPVPGVSVRTVDAAGCDTPAGVEGELWLRGPQAFAGYLDPSHGTGTDADGWFRTGDLAVLEPSGHVKITGRIKDIIIRNAENISALEVELAIAAHPDVTEVAVLALPDDRTGEQACAVIVVAAGRPPPTVADLRAHCGALGLAAQKAPERVEVVDVLPRNLLGKVQKRDLRQRYHPAPVTKGRDQ